MIGDLSKAEFPVGTLTVVKEERKRVVFATLGEDFRTLCHSLSSLLSPQVCKKDRFPLSQRVSA